MTTPWLDPALRPSVDDILFGADPRWFFELFLDIPTQAGSAKFHLFPWMHDVALSVTDHEIMLKSRDVGSSTFWIAEKLRKVLTHPGANLLIAADKEGNAVNLIRYARHMVQRLPDEFRPRVGKDNETMIEFPELGNYIKALPGTASSGRSERCTYLICTEMAFWEKPEEYFAAVTGALVAGGETVIESTANTTSDLFHEMWHDALNGYKKRFCGVFENPNHTEAWYDKRRLEIKEPHLFFREYPSTSFQAFQSSADIYFDKDDLEQSSLFIRPPLSTTPVSANDGEPLGYTYLWKRPLPGRHYVIGVDVAEGKTNARGKPDYSDAKVLDWQTGEHICTLHCRLTDDLFASEVFDLGKHYNDAFVAVERNGPGLAVIRTMQALGYTNLYYQEQVDDYILGSKTRTRHVGWLTSGRTKPLMISDLNGAIHAGDFISPDGNLWDEAKSFGRDLKAKGGAHDDQVISAAIAWQAKQAYRPTRSYQQVGEQGRATARRDYSWSDMFE
jgi:hypothetical protein